ncbi:MAG: hypothetical protein ACOC0N_07420 [Chroococcales cyanobacterium]
MTQLNQQPESPLSELKAIREELMYLNNQTEKIREQNAAAIEELEQLNKQISWRIVSSILTAWFIGGVITAILIGLSGL